MLHSLRSKRGMVVAPHHLAAQAGLAILREGGNAVEAMVAAAATIGVVYPHMNSIGGDGFWLIAVPGEEPYGIAGCGGAAANAAIDFYRGFGHEAIPARGGLAALTVAGTVSGWAKALETASAWNKPLPLARLLADAVAYAEEGVPLTGSHCAMVKEKLGELKGVPGFDASFLEGGVPNAGAILKNPALGAMLRRLAEAGLDDFYRGDIARSAAADLEAAGSPLRLADFEAHAGEIVKPLSIGLKEGEVYNLPPPTQGMASLMILGLYDRVRASTPDGFDHIHRIVESTKIAFGFRDMLAVDPRYAPSPPEECLTPEFLSDQAKRIDPARAVPWPPAPGKGDTIWMGAIDGEGRAVSFIQSTYWEFGSGVVLPRTGLVWQNRGTSFSLDPGSANPLMPGRKPFHTLNPALARLGDGRTLAYGTMGGDGQPQTQAAIFTRCVMHGYEPQAAVTAPRWLLGRTWGSHSATLKMEARFPPELLRRLEAAGHVVERVADFSPVMGHAGIVVADKGGVLSGAADPRSDGGIAAF